MPTLKQKIRSYLPRRKPRPAPEHHTRDNRHKERSIYFRTYEQPICENCEAHGIITDITPGGYLGALDHIIPVGYGGSPSDTRNEMGLCVDCHRIKTAMENASRGPLIAAVPGVGGLVPVRKEDIFKKLLI